MNNKQTEWFGNIPTSWSKCRIGSLYKLRNTKVSDKKYVPLSVTKEGVLPQLSSVAKSNAHDDRKLIKVGDFAINSRSDRRGSCGISKYEGSVSLINTILEPREMMSPQYYDWLFHTIQFSDEFYKWGHGIVDDLWTTGWQDMKKIEIPCPPLKIQEKIANFLDSKCSEIDSLVVDIQKEISILEEYKMSVVTESVTKGIKPNVELKNSGLDWINKIPKEWSKSKVKYLFSSGKGLSITKDNLVTEGIPVINYGQIHSKENTRVELSNTLLRYIPKSFIKKATNSQVNQYDFVFADTSEDYDGCGNCVYKRDDSITYAGYHTIVLHSINSTDNRYLAYLFTTDLWREQIRTKVSGIKVLSITQQIILNSSLILPPFEAQKEIADYLDCKCTEIEKVISVKQSQLELLAEYKKSLIYEYVTGKKEVI